MINNEEVIKKSLQKLTAKIQKACQQSAGELEKWTKDQITASQSPSAAGQPPHSESGTLRNSIRCNVTNENGRSNISVSVGTEYARFLEFGTSKMTARPFMRPSQEQAKKVLKQHLKETA